MKVATLLMVAAVLRAQDAPKFEVASIRIHQETGSGGISFQHGLYRNIGTNLKFLIMGAYDLRDFQVSGGPGWIMSERYDVVARADSNTTGKEGMLMMRSLLAERFKLAFHYETREQPVYELVVAKGGVKMQKSAEDAERSMRMGGGVVMTMEAKAMPIADLPGILSGSVQHTIVDKTGLSGSYDVKLHWTNDTLPSDVPTLFAALPEQLGLRLESRKGPVQFLVIDHAEHPTEN
jgi:uncharacterized protein (TIGR03435 family)